jgi:DNA-binding MarR family transcriptional regulator
MQLTTEEAQVLSVLDAIEANSQASQRELSRITGLNLAKVNHLLKKMAKRGVVKLHNISASPSKLRYLYILTPRGIAEKSRLTVRFVARTWRQYSDAIERLRLSLWRLRKSGTHRIALLGLNEVAQMVIEVVRGIDGLDVIALIDQDRAGDSHRGVPIVTYEQIDELDFDRLIPCDDGDFSLDDIAARIGTTKDKVWLV